MSNEKTPRDKVCFRIAEEIVEHFTEQFDCGGYETETDSIYQMIRSMLPITDDEIGELFDDDWEPVQPTNRGHMGRIRELVHATPGMSLGTVLDAVIAKLEERQTLSDARRLRIESQRCKKCGVTVAENKQKYCGDGSDKDNPHRWESEESNGITESSTRFRGVLGIVSAEVNWAMNSYPTWPTDPLHALAVLGEEFGELTKAMLQMTYQPHKTTPREVRDEAYQTAAMAIRLAMSLDRYQYKPSEQHDDRKAGDE
jgi:hypothetical protein